MNTLERLYARRELWREAVFERELLRKENTRLRAELAIIRSMEPAYTFTGRCETCTAMRDTARYALEVTL